MVITKSGLQSIIDTLPEVIDIEVVFDRILIIAKIDQALSELEQGLGKDWSEIKREMDTW